jgi:hypothetical protein
LGGIIFHLKCSYDAANELKFLFENHWHIFKPKDKRGQGIRPGVGLLFWAMLPFGRLQATE